MAVIWLCIAMTMSVGEALITDTSTCMYGTYCEQCPVSEIMVTAVGQVHVCCPGCSPYMSAGYTKTYEDEHEENNTTGHIYDDDYDDYDEDSVIFDPYCGCEYEADILGDCWRGKQCDVCDKSLVELIGLIPVCCQHCADVGMLAYDFSDFKTCYCTPLAGITTNITTDTHADDSHLYNYMV